MKKFKSKSHDELKKVLLSVLVVCLVIWVIVYIQINNSGGEQVLPSVTKSNQLTPTQRSEAISELKKVVASSTPLTDKERAQAIAELKKAIANQNK